MNADTRIARLEDQESVASRTTAVTSVLSVLKTRREHRARDFGVGYGNSSGYASNRRYASNWSEPRFRCA